MTYERVKGLIKIPQFLQLKARLFNLFKTRGVSTQRPAEFTQQMGSNEPGPLHSSTSTWGRRNVPPIRVLQLMAPPLRNSAEFYFKPDHSLATFWRKFWDWGKVFLEPRVVDRPCGGKGAVVTSANPGHPRSCVQVSLHLRAWNAHFLRIVLCHLAALCELHKLEVLSRY